MMDGEELRVRVVHSGMRAWLALNGTILTYRGRTWAESFVCDIPIEQISFEFKRGLRLGRAVLGAYVFGAVVAVGAIAAVVVRHVFDNPEGAENLLGMFVAAAIAAFLPFFAAMLVPQKQVKLLIGPEAAPLAFWLERKNRAELLAILRAVHERKDDLDPEAEPLEPARSNKRLDYLDLPRALQIASWCALPAIIFGNPWLLLLLLAPAGWVLYNFFKWLKIPAEVRKAFKLYAHDRDEEARQVLEEHIARHPDDLAAELLLLRVCIAARDLAAAGRLLAEIQEDIDPEAVQGIQQALLRMEDIRLRKDSGESPPGPEGQFEAAT
jgi:hypothetical protein